MVDLFCTSSSHLFSSSIDQRFPPPSILFKRMVRSYVTEIHHELGQLLEKMPWINTLKQPMHKKVPKFLHEILEFQGHCLEILSKEEEIKRNEAPPDTPVSIPKSKSQFSTES